MKAIWVLSILLASACSFSEAPTGNEECIDPSRKNPNGICTEEYRPVCGCNGVTYSNACEAGKDGALSWTQGACDCIDESKIPTDLYACGAQHAPVCGCNDVTYRNECEARRAGVTGWTDGECEKKPGCIDESKILPGPCTLEYMPVCGCNGVTYGNECEAKRAGVISWTMGGCGN